MTGKKAAGAGAAGKKAAAKDTGAAAAAAGKKVVPRSMPKSGKDPKGGLTAEGRRFFNETEGSHLRPGVKGPADTPEKKKRKGSFLTRHFTHPRGPMERDGEPTRLALSAQAWGETMPTTEAEAKRLAGKGRELLKEFHAETDGAAAETGKRGSGGKVVAKEGGATGKKGAAAKRSSGRKSEAGKAGAEQSGAKKAGARKSGAKKTGTAKSGTKKPGATKAGTKKSGV